MKVDEEQIYDNGHPKLEGRDLPPEVIAERREMEEGDVLRGIKHLQQFE